MLDSNIKTVGIFVNEDIKKVIQIACMVDLDVIQLHGDEDENYIKRLKDKLKLKNACKEIWKAIRVKDKESLNDIDTLDVDGLLLDTYSKEAYGGLGETFNWDLVKNLNLNKKLILAGGIDEENVEVAKSTVKPDIIDVSSGIETKGFKDFEIYAGVKNILNWTPNKGNPFIISRANDPFDNNVEFGSNGQVIATPENPYALTFDPNYVYAPNQGIRGFLGLRFNLK